MKVWHLLLQAWSANTLIAVVIAHHTRHGPVHGPVLAGIQALVATASPPHPPQVATSPAGVLGAIHRRVMRPPAHHRQLQPRPHAAPEDHPHAQSTKQLGAHRPARRVWPALVMSAAAFRAAQHPCPLPGRSLAAPPLPTASGIRMSWKVLFHGWGPARSHLAALSLHTPAFAALNQLLREQINLTQQVTASIMLLFLTV